VDYEETFAPVVKMITMRTIIVMVTSQGWPIHQMNIKNAFLYSDLKKIFIWNLHLVCSSPYISCV